jgi:hypothetical protein
MSAIKERGILFSAPMVSALLDGRKTVTRRAVKGIALKWLEEFDPSYVAHTENAMCPYGKPGERLWVRETWGVISHDFDEHGNMIDWEPDRPASAIREMRFGQGYYSGHVIYRADGEATWAGDDDGGGDDRSAWKPSIHMPRIASRILLEITDVRVERLQDITEDQAEAEGAAPAWLDENDNDNDTVHAAAPPTYRRGFAQLWRDINGTGAWDANPWVWVVEFRCLKP